MKSKLHYYSALDTVYFGHDTAAEVYATRAVSATGVLMLDMLIGGATPLLSQTQAFDNALLLDQLSQPSPDCRALLRLVRNNRLQVRILDTPALRQRSHHADRFTLLNAFCSALAQPEFKLSAWPELKEPELRAYVLHCLDYAPEKITQLTDRRIAARLEGLIEFDLSLRQSSAIERTPPVTGSGLASRVRASLTALVAGNPKTLRLINALLADPRLTESAGGDRRSTWYAALDEQLARDDAVTGSAYDPERARMELNIRGVIDGAYNSIVADSLGASGAFTLCPTEAVAEALAASHPESSSAGQLSSLVRDARRSVWLTWSKLDELLPDFDHMASPQRRLQYVLDEHTTFVGANEVDRRAGLALKVALPHAAASIMVGIAAGGLGESVGGGFGAAIGAGVAGMLSLMAAHPVVGRWQARWGARTRSKAAAQWEATVASGTASLPGMMER